MANTVVERGAVLVRRLMVERSRKGVAQLLERLLPGVHQVEVVGIALLGLVPVGGVVGAKRGVGVTDEPDLLRFEEVELALH